MQEENTATFVQQPLITSFIVTEILGLISFIHSFIYSLNHSLIHSINKSIKTLALNAYTVSYVTRRRMADTRPSGDDNVKQFRI